MTANHKTLPRRLPGLAVAVDSDCNTYIADTYNSRVRKVPKSTEDISTIAGDGVAGSGGDGGLAVNCKLNLPWGVAVDSSGNVYISDYENNYVREVVSSSGKIYAYAWSCLPRNW